MQKQQSKYLERVPHFVQEPNPEIYRSENYVVLDFETTNISNGSAIKNENKIILAAWQLGADHPRYKRGSGNNLYYKRANEYELSELVRVCEEADFIVAHNAKFELHWLVRCGLDPVNTLVYDTQIAEYVLLGNIRKPINLGATAKRHGVAQKDRLVGLQIKGKVCPSDIDRRFLLKYCLKDVLACHEIFRSQLKRFENNRLLNLVYTRCLLTPVLVDMERYGMKLDHEKVKRWHKEKAEELEVVNAELNELTGGINPNSPKQVAEFVYDTLGFKELKRNGKPWRTPSGGRKTDDATLNALKATNKKQRRFIELKKKQSVLHKQVSGYLEKMLRCCEENDGILYADLNQTRTKTHRLSSSGTDYKIQLQNIDRKFKELFISRHPDYEVAEIDGAQLEFRVAVYLGQDKNGMEDIANGVDKHRFTADVLTKAGKPTDRQDAKAETFKPLYGGQTGDKAQVAYYEAFRERHKQLYDTQVGWTYEVLEKKKLALPWGMIFHWPGTKMSHTGYISNTTAIFNYPVQSLATAEIIPIAVIYLWHYLKAYGMKSYLVNTIHDSAIAELFSEERELFQELAVKAFTTDVYRYLYLVYGIEFNVPLGTGFKAGPYWSAGEEIKHQVEPPDYKEVA